MKLLPTVRPVLLAAVRRVNARFNALPTERRPRVDDESWARLEKTIDQAFSCGDAEAAIEAVEQWEAHALRVIEEAGS